MSFLHLLEGIRNPFLNGLMQGITELGSEVIFLVAALVLFWCVDKRRGYYLLSVGFFGTLLNQFMKVACRIPRPWVRDPSLTIVESARAGATGYSFPSGHTQNAVGTYGVLAVTGKKSWFRWVCVALMVLIPFSRMYLGVHTPADVLVAAGTALLLIAILKPLIYSEKKDWFPTILSVMLVTALAFVAYVEFFPFPGDMDPVHLQEGTKNAYSLLGALIGMLLAYGIDRRYLHFEVEAIWWAQILKVVWGLALALVLKTLLKAPLLDLFGGHAVAHAVRYGLMVFFAAAIWPMTFPWFRNMGRK